METKQKNRKDFYKKTFIFLMILLLFSIISLITNGQMPDRWNVDVIHEQMGVNQVIKKDTSDLFLSGASIRYVPRKDTFIKVDGEEYLWYNAATWTYVDSSVYYNNLNFLTSILLKYRQECYNDSTQISRHTYKPPKSKQNIWSSECVYMDYNNGRCSIASHYSLVWIHKKPFEPFTDFIDWLERRNNGINN